MPSCDQANILYVSNQQRTEQISTDDCFQLASRLTYAEFCNLLHHVTKVDVCEIDSSLRRLVAIPANQFPGLIRCLVSRFPDQHRVFIGPDKNTGPVHYLVGMCL